MNIAFDAKRYFHNLTGLGNYSRIAVASLSEYFNNEKYFLCDAKALSVDSQFKLIKPSSFINKTFPSYWRSKGLLNDLLKNNIELYHGLSNEIPININKTKIKSVVTIHDLIFLKYPHLYPVIDRKIYEKKFSYACKYSDAVIATSEQTKADIIDYYNTPAEKIHVVYQAVEMKEIDDQIKTSVIQFYHLEKPYLLYVGRIEERKNLLLILRALKLLSNKEYKLIVIGNPEEKYFSQCQSYIQQNNLQSQVEFHQGIGNEELNVFYKNAKALVYPSQYEGFGIPIVEAQLSGTVVITNESGCFREVAADAALYVNTENEIQLSEAIKNVFDNESLGEGLIQRGFENSKRFSRKNFAEGLMKVYNSVTNH